MSKIAAEVFEYFTTIERYNEDKCNELGIQNKALNVFPRLDFVSLT